jgi:hypothetical protein
MRATNDSETEEFPPGPRDLPALVTAFEAGTLPRSEWTHREHLVVALWYFHHYSEQDALDRLRRGIRCYNESQGGANTATSGYHETLTVFWSRIVRGFLLLAEPEQPVACLAANLLATYGARRDLWHEYYSYDVVKCTEARRRWVEPDLKPLPLEELCAKLLPLLGDRSFRQLA